jgi:hypothetical protein
MKMGTMPHMGPQTYVTLVKQHPRSIVMMCSLNKHPFNRTLYVWDLLNTQYL